VEGCGGFQVWQFIGWVVFSRACRSLWSGAMEEYQERVGIFSGFARYEVGGGIRTKF
jgi:hypothetical protein